MQLAGEDLEGLAVQSEVVALGREDMGGSTILRLRDALEGDEHERAAEEGLLHPFGREEPAESR